MLKGEIGETIQRRRDYLDLKQEDLTEMAGVSSKTVYLLESGKGNPSINTLQKIIDVLGLVVEIQIKMVDE